MLKILIVDDDAMTRKGIRMLMPWAKHHMEIIGECSNGKEALAFLKENNTDLVLVDLDMPVMDGMTFIRTASGLYPELNYVVLTIHTEFKYIQDALRSGAIDYIAKTQFDKENFDQILDRIHANIIRKNSALTGPSGMKWKDSKILYPSIYALITVELETDEHIFEFWKLNGLSGKKDIYELTGGVWVFTEHKDSFVFPDCFPNTMLLRILDVSDMTFAQLGKLLRRFINDRFFYEYQPVKTINDKHAYELYEEEEIHNTETIEKLKKEWLSLNWVYENELFDQITFDLKSSKLKTSTLYHLLLALESVWNSAYSELTGEKISLPPVFHSWQEVEDWLIQVYKKTDLFQSQAKYSSSIVRSVLNIKSYVDSHYTETMDTTEAARNAQMSYGYFSRCFHDIIGVSFIDYCTQVRIEHAKQQLENTDKSIQEIAFSVGYNDEKYFSRTFKKITGVIPSDYRKGCKNSPG